MTKEWTPWVEHDGCGMPIPAGLMTQWVLEKFIEQVPIAPKAGYLIEDDGKLVTVTGRSYRGPAWDWENFGKINPATGNVIGRVLRYRIRRPRALLDLIETIETLPERQKEEA